MWVLWVGVGAEAAWAGQVLSRRPDGGAWFPPLGQPALQAVATCGPGLAFVESKEACEAAAAALGLSGTTAQDIYNYESPHGCFLYLGAHSM
jgi:hypothetical protein